MSEKITNIEKQSGSPADKNAPHETFNEGESMDRFVQVFEASARRWELVVYPAMLAFVVLMAYGFFLIYTLSKDIHTLANGMDPEMGKHLSDISGSVIYLSENVRTMTRRVYHMSESVEDISERMSSLEYLEPMLVNMDGMNDSMLGMNQNMNTMNLTGAAIHYEVGNMSNSIRPMGRMNSFMPW